MGGSGGDGAHRVRRAGLVGRRRAGARVAARQGGRRVEHQVVHVGRGGGARPGGLRVRVVVGGAAVVRPVVAVVRRRPMVGVGVAVVHVVRVSSRLVVQASRAAQVAQSVRGLLLVPVLLPVLASAKVDQVYGVVHCHLLIQGQCGIQGCGRAIEQVGRTPTAGPAARAAQHHVRGHLGRLLS